MRGTFAVFLLGLVLLTAGAVLFDWRAGLIVGGSVLALGSLFWDGDR